MYVCTHIYMHIYIHIQQLCIHVYTCIFVHFYVCLYTYICSRSVYIYIHIFMYMYAYTNTYMYIYINTQRLPWITAVFGVPTISSAKAAVFVARAIESRAAFSAFGGTLPMIAFLNHLYVFPLPVYTYICLDMYVTSHVLATYHRSLLRVCISVCIYIVACCR